ncbi:7998_t:CDS:2 [Scutellospora calospora]|uniref:7998_t:CDS:1 n=1 Tax=Scutellospora calospora TaxID=85575 RepID=A0ACA9M770_9GLOM|nr:7998_t:CDS:2 [Scutellospora calospora]
MTIKLIGYSRSPYTLRVIECLHELGLPYQLDSPANFQDLKSEDFLATKHPFGRIPVLIDDDFTIAESRPICRYLATKYQGKHSDTILIPNDIYQASLVDQYISYDISYYDPPITKIIYQEIRAKRNNETPDSAVVKQASEDLAKVLDVYEKLLKGKDYLNGEFSLADLFHCPTTYYVYSEVFPDLWNDRPNVKKWWDRLNNRPAWKKTLEDRDKN